MSEIDHFIEEVTEEVRRDRLFALYKKYGWIAALIVVLLVGGAAFNEYRKAQAVAAAQELGDRIVAAMAADDAVARSEALAAIEAGSANGRAVLGMLTASTQSDAGRTAEAAEGLEAVAGLGETAEIYRQIASFKALTLQADTLPVADLRQRYEALAQPGAPLRLLAEEQLALIDVAQGDRDAAITRLQAILQDAEANLDLQQRVGQLIVALGGKPEPRPDNRQG